MEATTRDLRLHTAEVLAAIERGEQVIITYHGKRRAVLTRWQEADTRRHRHQTNPAFGLWADKTDSVDNEIRQLRQRRDLP
ncbi:type II toxin-antitoxin system Phd/YefM family antitoxin [Thiohalophilus sp.]|uniref:type II toxin-antitoxin system Phd/YefM family antitoxin n=1 Tax=Thiohalophilus sp. TaxID=3028392 RepID=UPI003A0FF12D